jgi:hypothetical protein
MVEAASDAKRQGWFDRMRDHGFAWFDVRPSANEAPRDVPTRRPRPHIRGNRFGDLEIAAVFDFFHFQQLG